MRAVVFAEPGRVEVSDVPGPLIRHPADALVRVTRAAICGSDLHFLHAKTPTAPGQVLGHEAVGVVEAVGGEVASVRPGDRVVLSFAVACGACWFCARGETNLCEHAAVFGAGPFGGNLAGTQAESVRVPWADVNLLPVPATVDDERAVFVGDVLTTGYHAASLAGAGPDDIVAVVGAGPVGWCTALSLRTLGVERVFLLDREPARLALAAEAGATPVHVGDRSAESVLAEVTGDRGADAAVDAVGAVDAYRTASTIVRRGGRVVVAGVYAGETVELQLGVAWARALDIRFTGICPVHARWREVMRLVTEGVLDPLAFVSDRVRLADAAEGYRRFAAHEATKVLVEP
ncbi:MAG TPA: alcohol dehydrogenase catalytic domain-containing protein [Actinomycetota bacterium]|nr:alcohol dehydrogenase catalytic domain-containing protein [Actinomycetota bacterium]